MSTIITFTEVSSGIALSLPISDSLRLYYQIQANNRVSMDVVVGTELIKSYTNLNDCVSSFNIAEGQSYNLRWVLWSGVLSPAKNHIRLTKGKVEIKYVESSVAGNTKQFVYDDGALVQTWQYLPGWTMIFM